MSAKNILRHAATVMAERCKAYGSPASSMERVARRWTITLGHPVTPVQVVLCMIDLKLARLSHDPRHHDSAVDVINYAAMLAEVNES